jgi:6-phosphogluconate dehydrogenase (decarboxylating)
MQIGMIGLGKMGGNMSRRLMKAGHHCVAYSTPTPRRAKRWRRKVPQPSGRWRRWSRRSGKNRVLSG